MEMRFTPGDLLLFKPNTVDIAFRNSVLLMLEGDDNGEPLGFILNKSLKIKVAELIEDTPINVTTYFGGPNGLDTFHYIHRLEEISDAVKIMDGLFWGGSYDIVKSLGKKGKLTDQNCRFFLGSFSWKTKSPPSLVKDTKNYKRIGKIRVDEAFFPEDKFEDWKILYLESVSTSSMKGAKVKDEVNEHLKLLDNCELQLAKNKIIEVINILLERQAFGINEFLKEIILLSRRYNEIASKSRMRIILDREEAIEKNQIAHALLEVIHEVKKKLRN